MSLVKTVRWKTRSEAGPDWNPLPKLPEEEDSESGRIASIRMHKMAN